MYLACHLWPARTYGAPTVPLHCQSGASSKTHTQDRVKAHPSLCPPSWPSHRHCHLLRPHLASSWALLASANCRLHLPRSTDVSEAPLHPPAGSRVLFGSPQGVGRSPTTLTVTSIVSSVLRAPHIYLHPSFSHKPNARTSPPTQHLTVPKGGRRLSTAWTQVCSVQFLPHTGPRDLTQTPELNM